MWFEGYGHKKQDTYRAPPAARTTQDLKSPFPSPTGIAFRFKLVFLKTDQNHRAKQINYIRPFDKLSLIGKAGEGTGAFLLARRQILSGLL
ncbi:hypothetical protein TH63_15080 [Rufibacter radiotolerans]|uniref:Uncharacterized protein n=1 Tax=Rufibacter radiotolerans TaxID=1379910 RepID=A0A0H4W883_9BACT|nr:hypothetical protein TH63_15080 [Rufibacter radiotolerans]